MGLAAAALTAGIVGGTAAPAAAATYGCTYGTLSYTSVAGQGDDYWSVSNTSGQTRSIRVQVWATSGSGKTWDSTTFSVPSGGSKTINKHAWYIVVTYSNGLFGCARENY